MKLVITTQYKENYGAHDWDGVGECPQYWKFKGGDTYVIEVSLAQAQDPKFYSSIERCIEHSSNYCEEYIIDQRLVDDCDFDPNAVVDSWDTYIAATYEQSALNCARDVKHWDGESIVGRRTWTQDAQGQRDVALREFA